MTIEYIYKTCVWPFEICEYSHSIARTRNNLYIKFNKSITFPKFKSNFRHIYINKYKTILWLVNSCLLTCLSPVFGKNLALKMLARCPVLTDAKIYLTKINFVIEGTKIFLKYGRITS